MKVPHGRSQLCPQGLWRKEGLWPHLRAAPDKPQLPDLTSLLWGPLRDVCAGKQGWKEEEYISYRALWLLQAPRDLKLGRHWGFAPHWGEVAAALLLWVLGLWMWEMWSQAIDSEGRLGSMRSEVCEFGGNASFRTSNLGDALGTCALGPAHLHRGMFSCHCGAPLSSEAEPWVSSDCAEVHAKAMWRCGPELGACMASLLHAGKVVLAGLSRALAACHPASASFLLVSILYSACLLLQPLMHI